MSKLIDVNKKIEETVVDGYEKIEDAVVGGYKKIEDKFVDTFLKKDGETTEKAKLRLAKEQEELKDEQATKIENMPRYSKTTEEIQAEIKEKYNI